MSTAINRVTTFESSRLPKVTSTQLPQTSAHSNFDIESTTVVIPPTRTTVQDHSKFVISTRTATSLDGHTPVPDLRSTGTAGLCLSASFISLPMHHTWSNREGLEGFRKGVLDYSVALLTKKKRFLLLRPDSNWRSPM